MRGRAVLWRIVVVAAWVAALVGLAALEPDNATWYIAAGIPLTILVGAVVNRWWVVLAPLPVTVVWLVAGRIASSSCESCEPIEWPAMLVIGFMIFTAPAIAALAFGVALRRLPRRRAPREQHA
jgi:hypothetical protein